MTMPGGMLTQHRPRRSRTGAPGSSGGDGNYDANGMMTQPGVASPGQQTSGASALSQGSPAGRNDAMGSGVGVDANGVPAARMQQGGQQQPAPNFQQLQAQGMARPAPQHVQSQFMQGGGGSVGGQLQQSVQQALASPSRYDLPQVQQVRSALQQQLQTDFDARGKSLNDEMGRRGLSESTIAGQRYSDLGAEQSHAMANIDAQLLQNYAATQAQDMSASLGAGQNYENSLQGRGLDQQQLDLSRQLGLGGLGVQQQQADTSRMGTMGNLGLGQGQLDLSKQLGLGNLGLDQQRLAQQGTQFDQQQALAKQLGLGNLGLDQERLAQQGSQFGQSLAEQTAGRLQSGSQFDKSFGLQQNAQDTQKQQFMDQLAQQLGLATMSDKTANRGIDANAALAQNDLMMKLMTLLGNADLSKFFGTSSTKTNTSDTRPRDSGTRDPDTDNPDSKRYVDDPYYTGTR